jgi:hypothetical protein
MTLSNEPQLGVFLSPFKSTNRKETCTFSYQVFQLPTPSTGAWNWVAFDRSTLSLFQILSTASSKNSRDDPSSWMIGDWVSQDGSIGLLSPIDPMFYIIYFVGLVVQDTDSTADIPEWNQCLSTALSKLQYPLNSSASRDHILNLFSIPESSTEYQDIHHWIILRLKCICRPPNQPTESSIYYYPDPSKITAWINSIAKMYAATPKSLSFLNENLPPFFIPLQ